MNMNSLENECLRAPQPDQPSMARTGHGCWPLLERCQGPSSWSLPVRGEIHFPYNYNWATAIVLYISYLRKLWRGVISLCLLVGRLTPVKPATLIWNPALRMPLKTHFGSSNWRPRRALAQATEHSAMPGKLYPPGNCSRFKTPRNLTLRMRVWEPWINQLQG